MTQTLLEFDAAVVSAPKARGLWRATLITPGQGSSGNWTEDVIRRDGPHALKKGAKCFVTHNRMENGEPDPFSMWGVLASDAWYEDGVGLVADIQVLESWIDKVADVAPHTALSVFLMGEADEQGNITAILEDVQNGVDLVVYPGRPGSSLVEKLYESAKAGTFNRTEANAAEVNKEGRLMPEDVKELAAAVAALGEKVDKLTAGQVETAQAQVDADAVAAEVDTQVEARVAKIKDAVEAVKAAEADMLPSSAKSLMESAYKGLDVAAGIESAKAVKVEALATLKAEAAKPAAESGHLAETGTPRALRGFTGGN
ncbi:capsid maturation protease [Microbacterium phage Welcome]|nr:capsid maturation protease [Microbacterium phage Welcome]